jgi:hypothetical protein
MTGRADEKYTGHERGERCQCLRPTAAALGALLLTRSLSYIFNCCIMLHAIQFVYSYGIVTHSVQSLRRWLELLPNPSHGLARMPCLPAAVRALPDSAATGGRAC